MKKNITICLLFLCFSIQPIFAQLANEDAGESYKLRNKENSARGKGYIYPGNRQASNFIPKKEEILADNCGQGDDSNDFEDGRNISSDAVFRNTDDFIVSPNSTLNIKSIEFNILSSEPITSLDINFFNDQNGAPGSTVVESVSTVVPYAQILIGNAFFQYKAYAVFVEVDLNFEGGNSGATYWMQPVAHSPNTAFWEVSSVGNLGARVHNSEDGGPWEPDLDYVQTVFKLHCDVATPPDQACFFNFTEAVEPITRLKMANVDNISSVNSTEILEDFSNTIINTEAGSSYDVTIEGYTNGEYTDYFTIFVNTSTDNDWVTYETFEIGSITGSTGTDGQKVTRNITLPTSLQEGEYLLRVVKNFNDSPMDPCSADYSYGQGEDYTLFIGEPVDCSGIPDADAAAVTPEQGNINSSYTVTGMNHPFTNGLTYQWQSNTEGAGWENEGDLVDRYSSFEATAPAESGIEVAWRLELTCTLSQETAYSEIAIFSTRVEPVYCIPELYCESGDIITNVTFEGIDNTTTCSSNGYGDYTAMQTTVQSGGTYPISITVGVAVPTESVSVWIDFDKNGIFDENEFFFIGTGSGEALTGTISIPENVADGNHRMRVRLAGVEAAEATWVLACDETQYYGETEDYNLIVDGVAGVDDNAVYNFTYYPNPVNEVLFLAAKQNIKSVSVYNVLGQEVLSNKYFTDGKVDVSSLPTGIFIFQLTFESGQIENFKVLKN